MNKNLADDARLTEIGNILALGALRMLQDKRKIQNYASKTLLAPN